LCNHDIKFTTEHSKVSAQNNFIIVQQHSSAQSMIHYNILSA